MNAAECLAQLRAASNAGDYQATLALRMLGTSLAELAAAEGTAAPPLAAPVCAQAAETGRA